MALKVLVSTMSAPASRYSRWIAAMIVGLGQGEQVVVALEVAGPVGEPLAAVARLVGPVPLDQRAHGAVDHQDPLARAPSVSSVGGVGASGRGHGLLSERVYELGSVHGVDAVPAW